MRGHPGSTMSGTEDTTVMVEEEEVTTPAAPAGGRPRPGPRPATEDRAHTSLHSAHALII